MKAQRGLWLTRWCVGGCVTALALVAIAGTALVSETDPAYTTGTPDSEAASAAFASTTAATPPTTTETVPASTAQSPSTSVATLPNGVTFVETFDGNAGLDRFDSYVFHRNIDVHDFDGFSGGSWSADHDLDCGTPETQRTMTFDAPDSLATRRGNSFYTCRDHVMTSMGDVENYSIAAFSPAQVFDSVSQVAVDVNLTDLGNRQWWKIGVLSTADCPALDRRCMYSDVDAADLDTDLDTSGRLIVSWSGGLSAGYPGGMKIGDVQGDVFVDAGADKRTRHPVSITDHGNGTVTFRVADRSVTMEGAFPACPCRVVFYDHNYTPDKNEAAPGTQYGYTWHWDNVEIRS